MRNEELEELKRISLEVAREQDLYVLDNKQMNIIIDYRSPVNGTKKRYGTIKISKRIRLIQIYIYTTTAQFFKNPNGRYKDKAGNSYVRGVGKDLPLSVIKETIAHELAHIKYLRHGRQHREYTADLNDEIDIKIKQYVPLIASRITQENIQIQRES